MSRTHELRQAQQVTMDRVKQAVDKNRKDRKGRENILKCTVQKRGDTSTVKKETTKKGKEEL